MKDMISRKMAIDAIRNADVCVQWNGIISNEDVVDITVRATKRNLIYSVKKLPSAQPETHEKRTETHGVCLDAIDRQAVFDALDNIKIPRNASWYPYYQQALTAVSKLPSAQPEIVKCKDCKYWTHIKRTNRYWCKTDDGLFDLNPSPDDFCSRAERRTDEAQNEQSD